MTKYERYTSKDGATLTMSQWGGSPAELELYRKLAELEDKIENGTLVDCPYKLGTELHFIVFNMCSGEFEIFTTAFWVYVSRYKDEFGGVEFVIEINDVDFDNNTLIEVCHFLTEAEAKAKLKELQGERE